MQPVEEAVEHVIDAIHENYGEELCIDDLARTAMYSKFHFTRIFQRVTGLTPGRFLSAVRLQKAKQLLTATSLTVTDISHLVGYTSVGTFSSRFAHSVGVPPRTYRRLGGSRPWVSFEDSRCDGGRRTATRSRSTVRGTISATDVDDSGPVFVGLFPGKVPEGEPVRCTVLDHAGPYVLNDVPPGSWYVMACCLPDAQARQSRCKVTRIDGYVRAPREEGMAIGFEGPLSVDPGVARLADLELRPMCPLDPPVLLALPDMESDAAVPELASAAAVPELANAA